MKKLIVSIFFSLLFINSYPQDNLLYNTANDEKDLSFQSIHNVENIVCDTDCPKQVSVIGAALLSTFIPGSGLYLTKNYLPATLYLVFTVCVYSFSIIVLDINSDKNFKDILPIPIAGGIIHIISIIHTIKATDIYNGSIDPIITYNGKNVQFGLSIKL